MSHAPAITQFVLDEFLPDVAPGQLRPDDDLVASGVIDSLGLLKVIAWLEHRFGIPVHDVELDPDSLRSVEAIDRFIRGNTEPTGSS